MSGNKVKNIHGELHRLVLLKVETRDEFGAPRTCTLLLDDAEPIKLEGGEEFITAWVPAKTVAKAQKGRA